MRIEKKQEIANNFKLKFEKSESIILSDYQGINVEKINALRSTLKKSESEFSIVKNSLLIRASNENHANLMKDDFKGPSAVIISYGKDPISSIKILNDFSYDNPTFKLKCGVLSGRFITKDDIKVLAKLPSRDILIAQLLVVLSGPTFLVRLLKNIICGLINVLQALREKKNI